MVNAALKSSWLIVAWLLAVTMVVGASMAMGASLSTTAVLLGIAPVIIIALLAHPEPSPSVAQMLRSGETKDNRS